LEAVLVLIAAPRAEPRQILFCRSKNQEREIWEGFRYGPVAAAETFGFDMAYSIDDIDTELPKLIANQPALFYGIGVDSAFDAELQKWLGEVRMQTRAGVSAPTAAFDVRALLNEMRLFKDTHEIGIMARAAQISAEAHIRAMQATRPGLYEYQVEAELLHEFKMQGSPFPAYGSIVAGGANACVLHYVGNDKKLNAGDLLLIDAGCELDGYASDITRTFPVSGTFSGPQRALYELVLDAQSAAIVHTRPGSHWNEPHEVAVKVLAQGMLDLGLLQGSLDGVLESGSYRQFYMHRTGHWLGMDVHDVGDYREKNSEKNTEASAERPWRTLLPGMVLTVEPGIYVSPAAGVPEQYWNIGIRIEDDAHVTPEGCEILTAGVPKKVADIEALMRAA
jgi:Xaa-Pro aminopeptidase